MRVLAFVLMCVVSTSVFALPTLDDVEHAVHRQDYVAAESLTREVVAARPDNAKAHYILAEILAHEGKTAEARTQAADARRLDPDIRFTTPDRFRQFEAQLNGTTPAARPRSNPGAEPAAAKPAESSTSGFSSFWVILVIGAIVAFFVLRRRPSAAPGYGSINPNAPTGMPGAPNYGGPGYPPSSGIGGTIAAGLGGVATGMLAEHLIEGALDRRHDNSGGGNVIDSTPTQDPQSIDFGSGNDWGSDSSGGDAGGGFDGGGSSDWS